MHIPSVRRVYALMHTLGCIIYFLTWVFDSVLFIAKVVEDLENEQADGKHLVFCMWFHSTKLLITA